MTADPSAGSARFTFQGLLRYLGHTYNTTTVDVTSLVVVTFIGCTHYVTTALHDAVHSGKCEPALLPDKEIY